MRICSLNIDSRQVPLESNLPDTKVPNIVVKVPSTSLSTEPWAVVNEELF